MEIDNYFALLSERAWENLRNLADQIKGVNPIATGSFRVSTGNLNKSAEKAAIIYALSTQIQSMQSCIYYVQIINNPNLQEVERSFLLAKETNLRAYPRFNCQSEFLYVGSSSNLIQRVKERLGYGSTRTYSLQLAHWAVNLNLGLDFIYAQYAQGIPPEVIQIIEDTLWDKLCPMFGHKGRR